MELRQQTGFRADKALLNRFRSRLALEGTDMGHAIERLIVDFMEDSSRPVTASSYPMPDFSFISATGLTGDDLAAMRYAVTLIRKGGEGAEILRLTLRSLRNLHVEKSGEDGFAAEGSFNENHPANSARYPVTDERIAAVERMAQELSDATQEARGIADDSQADGGRSSAGRRRMASGGRLAGAQTVQCG